MKLQREYPTNPSAAPLSRLALVVALARASVAVAEQVGREKPAEERGPLPRPVGQDPRHQASVLVVEHRDRDLAEEGEGMDVAVDPGLGRRRRIATHEAGVAVRQVHDEEMRLLPHPADDHHRLAEIGLRIPRRMRQRHEHLAAAPLALPHVILHDRVAAGEAMLVAKPFEHPLRGVPLFAVNLAITLQPAIDDPGELVQLRPPHRDRPPISGRYREGQHLADAVTRDAKMPGRLSLAHAFRTSQANLAIHLHGDDPPALPRNCRKDKGGRLLRRPQRGQPAATVADFSTAVLRQRRKAWVNRASLSAVSAIDDPAVGDDRLSCYVIRTRSSEV